MKKILWLAVATIVGFGIVGYALIYFALNLSITEVFDSKYDLWFQLLIGAGFGILSAILAWKVVILPYFLETRIFFVQLIRSMKLNLVEIIFISLCAGIGEEFFFRGGLQPIIGVWLTAIIFVALHGYLNPKNLPLTVYGIFMIFIIVGFGYLTEEFGLLSAMVAHTAVDIVLLYQLSHDPLEIHDDDDF